MWFVSGATPLSSYSHWLDTSGCPGAIPPAAHTNRKPAASVSLLWANLNERGRGRRGGGGSRCLWEEWGWSKQGAAFLLSPRQVVRRVEVWWWSARGRVGSSVYLAICRGVCFFFGTQGHFRWAGEQRRVRQNIICELSVGGNTQQHLLNIKWSLVFVISLCFFLVTELKVQLSRKMSLLDFSIFYSYSVVMVLLVSSLHKLHV